MMGGLIYNMSNLSIIILYYLRIDLFMTHCMNTGLEDDQN